MSPPFMTREPPSHSNAVSFTPKRRVAHHCVRRFLIADVTSRNQSRCPLDSTRESGSSPIQCRGSFLCKTAFRLCVYFPSNHQCARINSLPMPGTYYYYPPPNFTEAPATGTVVETLCVPFLSPRVGGINMARSNLQRVPFGTNSSPVPPPAACLESQTVA